MARNPLSKNAQDQHGPAFVQLHLRDSQEVGKLFSVESSRLVVHWTALTHISLHRSSAKMEVCTSSKLNPILQDTKKGRLRHYPFNIEWNYGCLPQVSACADSPPSLFLACIKVTILHVSPPRWCSSDVGRPKPHQPGPRLCRGQRPCGCSRDRWEGTSVWHSDSGPRCRYLGDDRRG